ncbi:hypothetical protein ACTA71_000638 [Dictyostelium dimigraforme]
MSKVLAIVTGASKGFGKAIAQEIVKGNPNKSQSIDLVLFARSLDGLKSTKESIETISTNAKVIDLQSLDMSNIPDVELKFKSVLENIKWEEYSKICFFNNHGTLYHLGRIEDFSDYKNIQKDNDTNTTSFVVITSLLVKKLKELGSNYSPEVTIVNSSSLCAIKAFPTWSLYCSSRAYRDMFFQALSQEYKSNDKFKVLNYSLGVLDTDMQSQVREECSEEDKSFYVGLKNDGKLINPNKSASVCTNLVYSHKFETGSHLDYYDLDK